MNEVEADDFTLETTYLRHILLEVSACLPAVSLAQLHEEQPL